MADLLSVFKDYSPSTEVNPMNSLIDAYKSGVDIRGAQLEQQALIEKLQRERDLQQQISNLGKLASNGDMNALGHLSALAPDSAKGVMDFMSYRNQLIAQAIRSFNKDVILANKPAAYQALKRQATDLGIDISSYPDKYDPKIAQQLLDGTLNGLMTIEQQLKEESESVNNRLHEEQINSQIIGQNLDRAKIGSEFSKQNLDRFKMAKYAAEVDKLNKETADLKLSKPDQIQLNASREKANSAFELMEDVKRVKNLIPQVKFSPLVGEGIINNAINLLHGTGREANEFKALTTKLSGLILGTFKGAYSDFEQKIARTGVPSLANTPEGAKAMAEITEAQLQRQIEKASFEEEYLKKHGNLNGANANWRKFLDENHILNEEHDVTQGSNGSIITNKRLSINKDNISKWHDYLD